MMDMSALFRLVHLSPDATTAPIVDQLAIAGVALYAAALAFLWAGARWREHHA